MGANQRTATTTYSNMGAYGGENIGTGHGEPAVANTTRYGSANAPQKNMSQIIWNAGFSSDAQWSSTDGTSSSSTGPNGSSSTGSSGEAGMSGNSHNWSTSVASGVNATGTIMSNISNQATFTVSAGGSGYSSTPSVTVLFDADNNGSFETTVTWVSGPTATMSGGSVASIAGVWTHPSPWSSITDPNRFQVSIDAAPSSAITVSNNTCRISTQSAHTQYIYSSGTNSGQTGLIDITGNTIHWSETPINLEEETDFHVFIKMTMVGSGGSNADDIQLLIGTAPDDDTYGIYKINPDMGGVLPQSSPYTASSSAKHGIAASSGTTFYWRLHLKADGAPVPGFTKTISEKLTLTGADSSSNNAVAYGLVSGGSTTGGLSSIVIVSGGSGYQNGEVLTVTGTRSSHAVGRATAVGTGALTGATVTTAGTGYHAGNVCFTLKSRGNTGYTAYDIKQIECYIPNKLESAAFSRAPTGDIYAGRNVVANLNTAVISGDFADTSVVRGQFDFSYDASDGMQNDFTGTTAHYSYPLDSTAGFRTIRTVAYIDNVTPAGAAWQSNYTSFNNQIGTDSVYLEERNPIFTAHTTESSARGIN